MKQFRFELFRFCGGEKGWKPTLNGTLTGTLEQAQATVLDTFQCVSGLEWQEKQVSETGETFYVLSGTAIEIILTEAS